MHESSEKCLHLERNEVTSREKKKKEMTQVSNLGCVWLRFVAYACVVMFSHKFGGNPRGHISRMNTIYLVPKQCLYFREQGKMLTLEESANSVDKTLLFCPLNRWLCKSAEAWGSLSRGKISKDKKKSDVAFLCRLTAVWKSRNQMESAWVKTRCLVAV